MTEKKESGIVHTSRRYLDNRQQKLSKNQENQNQNCHIGLLPQCKSERLYILFTRCASTIFRVGIFDECL
jgi:hypothetical protein